MKIFYVNLDVGSGIEQTGNVVLSWINELQGVELFEYKLQNPANIFNEALVAFSPDVIILNESYPRVRPPVVEYVKNHPSTKLIYLNHSWKEIYYRKQHCDSDDYAEFINVCTKIFCLNVIPKDIIEKLPSNIDNFYHPIDPNEFKISTPWRDRPKNFLYLGGIFPDKFSWDFINEIDKTEIQIDCYGQKYPNAQIENKEEYYKLFDSCKNIHYKGIIPQEDVSRVLNEYKYFVMPHNSAELFNMCLLQAILCGTVPLITNDESSKEYDPSWIYWADGLYYSCRTASDLINNLVKISNENLDSSIDSEQIRKEAVKRFDYKKFKSAFQEYLKSLIRDCDKKLIWDKTPISKQQVIQERANSQPQYKYESSIVADRNLVLGREIFINPRVGPCGATRTDSIYPIGDAPDFESFKRRATTIARGFNANNSYSGEADTYAVEQYLGLEGENIEWRGKGKAFYLFKKEGAGWAFYKDEILQFVSSADQLDSKW